MVPPDKSKLTDQDKDLPEPVITASDEGRTALALGTVELSSEIFHKIKERSVSKGDVLTVAEITGIFGAKQTSNLFAFCNPNTLSDISIEFNLQEENHAIKVQSFIKSPGKAGVEMEALTAVTTACLAIYDMCKSLDNNIRINDIHLLSKTAGTNSTLRSN